MAKQEAFGLLMWRKTSSYLEYFLVHPGGPLYKNKRTGVWSIPKGLKEKHEDDLETAIREFHEETGITPMPPFLKLKPITQKSGKTVHAWAFKGEWDPKSGIKSNFFEMEWPPKSGRKQTFPEQDEAAWFTIDKAKEAINPAQFALLEQAETLVQLNLPA